MNESRLVHETMQELGKHGAIFRTNAGQFYTKSGHRVGGLPKGFTDVLFIRTDGQACFVERKTQGYKVTPEQTQFIERMKSLGARAGVAYSVVEALMICGIERKDIKK
jgi:hypothetical protein